LRTQKRISLQGGAKAQLGVDMTTVFVQEEFARIAELAKETLAAMESGDTLRTQLSVLKKLTKSNPANTVQLKRRIASRVIEAERYVP
ncbi:hypothetical protein BN871_CD_00010, partial [Paenibacillus sp. P22]